MTNLAIEMRLDRILKRMDRMMTVLIWMVGSVIALGGANLLRSLVILSRLG